MKDEILAKALSTDTEIVPRYDIVKPDGTKLAENAELVLKNAVTQQGTPYNKASVLTDETAAKIWPAPPEEPNVNGVLGNLADLAGAITKLPVGSGYTISAGDVVDVVDGKAVRPTLRDSISEEEVASINTSYSTSYAYLHRVNDTDYLLFYNYDASSYALAACYFSIENAKIKKHATRVLEQGMGFLALSNSYIWDCANLPDGRVLFAYNNGTYQYVQVLTLDKNAATISSQYSSLASGANIGAIIYTTNTEFYAASCYSSSNTYTINIGKFTISNGTVAFSNWVKNFTSPTISGITAQTTRSTFSRFLNYGELTNEGVLAFVIPYNSTYVLQAVNVMYDATGGTWILGGTDTIKNSFQVYAGSRRFWLFKTAHAQNVRTAHVIIDAKEDGAIYAALATLQYDTTTGEETTSAKKISEYQYSWARCAAEFTIENKIVVYVSEGASNANENIFEYVLDGTGTVSARKELTYLGPASSSTIRDLLALSGDRLTLIEARASHINSTLSFSVNITAEMPTTSQAIALDAGNAGEEIRIAYSGNVPFPGVTKGTKITSGGVNAESYADGYLRIESPSLIEGVQIAYGSYIGTGSGGTSQGTPMVLTFPFSPKLVLISTASGFAESTTANNTLSYRIPAVAIRGQTEGFLRKLQSGGSYNTTLEWGEKSLSWYNIWSNGGNGQIDCALNVSGTTYYYVAIG